MRNVIIILALFLSIAIHAQDKSITLAPGLTLVDFDFVAADTITNNDQLYYIDVAVNKDNPLTQDCYISLDSVSGSPQIAVILQGKKFEGNDYTNIGSATTWYGSSSDTTFVLSNASANRYRYIRIKFDATATAQKSLIDDVRLKVWNE